LTGAKEGFNLGNMQKKGDWMTGRVLAIAGIVEQELGGCTAHHAVISVCLRNRDRDEIEKITGDPSRIKHDSQ